MEKVVPVPESAESKAMQLRPKHTVFRRVRDVRVDVREPAVGLEHWHAVTLLVNLTSEGTVRLDGKGQIKKMTIEASLSASFIASLNRA